MSVSVPINLGVFIHKYCGKINIKYVTDYHLLTITICTVVKWSVTKSRFVIKLLQCWWLTLKCFCDHDRKSLYENKGHAPSFTASKYSSALSWMQHVKVWWSQKKKQNCQRSLLSSCGSQALRLTGVQYETFPPRGWEGERWGREGRDRRRSEIIHEEKYDKHRTQHSTESIKSQQRKQVSNNKLYHLTVKLIWGCTSLPSTLSGRKLILMLKAL